MKLKVRKRARKIAELLQRGEHRQGMEALAQLERWIREEYTGWRREVALAKLDDETDRAGWGHLRGDGAIFSVDSSQIRDELLRRAGETYAEPGYPYLNYALVIAGGYVHEAAYLIDDPQMKADAGTCVIRNNGDDVLVWYTLGNIVSLRTLFQTSAESLTFREFDPETGKTENVCGLW